MNDLYIDYTRRFCKKNGRLTPNNTIGSDKSESFIGGRQFVRFFCAPNCVSVSFLCPLKCLENPVVYRDEGYIMRKE